MTKRKKLDQVTVVCWAMNGNNGGRDLCFLTSSLLGRGLDSVGIGPGDVLWPIAQLVDRVNPGTRSAKLEIRARIVRGE